MTSTNQTKKTQAKLSLTMTAKVTAVVMGAGSILPAHAFLNDTSSQRVVMIGNGGAENMQKIKVQTISTPAQNQSSQSQSYYTQPNHNQQNFQANPSYKDYGNNQAYYGQVHSQSSYAPPVHQSQSYQPFPIQSYGQPSQNLPNSNQFQSSQNFNTQTINTQGLNTQNLSSQMERLVLNTNSAAVAVIDAQSGKSIYEKNIDATRSIASITKMMTAMVVVDSNEDMSQQLIIKANDLVGAKNASTRLKVGDRLSRSEFMLMMLMKSENPAAKTLATSSYGGYDHFIAQMNAKAQSLGMHSTRFSDSSGLNPRNVSTASDLVKMMREIATNPKYQTIRNFSSVPSYDFYITNYSLGNRVYKAASTSPLVRSGNYPILASKTGFIREAGYCLVMETSVNGRPSIIVLLGANGSQNRWKDAENIIGQLAYR